MNKIILMGRLTRDPEVRYSNAAEPMAIVRYTLAVNRSRRRDGEPDADFINCTVFGKSGEFAERYFRKGMQILISGRLQIRQYEQNGQKQWYTEVLVDEQQFTESKAAFEARGAGQGQGGYNQAPPQYNQPQQQYQQQPQYAAPPQDYGYQAPPQAQAPPPGPPQPPSDDSFFAIDQNLDDDDLPF
jgi:single-strand DNA-binding protein